MPPKGSTKLQTPSNRESSIDKTSEYEDFMRILTEYHEKRGTVLEREPKIGTRHLDLYRLYLRVCEEGGYDLVSDTKAKPLMWRTIAGDFLGKSPHLAAQAFMVKSAYYRNLVAYEITNHWKKTPPPKEILEDLTAKGGNVMGRTLDNFARPHTREEGNLANGNSSDAENDEDGTPKKEKADGDELPGSAAGRSSRGLRQAPPQRVLFNPDTAPARQARNTSIHQPSPTPGATLTNGLHHPPYPPNGTSMTLANYEPRQQYPLSLKPVTTPGNNPEHYRLKRKHQQEANASHVAKKYKGLMLPGTGFIGPNIYVRAQLALQSGIPDEEQYALHHLVKISHERGDKYRFDQFAGLAEALVAKVLQVSKLFYDVDWAISYGEDESAVPGQTPYLDGVHGTSDVLDKLKTRVPLDVDDHIQPSYFTLELGRITEAALVIRNMVMLEENAHYISKLPLIRDYICIVLNLRPHPAVVELQNYALDTAEQLTKYFDLDPQDVLYQSLLAQLQGRDRGKIVTSLKALARVAMRFPTNKRLEDVPLAAVENVCEWIMVEDEELRTACLDFLFQYTSIADNVETLVLDTDIQRLVRQLSSLLLFQAKPEPPRTKPQPLVEEEQPTLVPRLAPELVKQLLRYNEPERSSHWLRMCFQDDPNSAMTQIHLWQSYQGTFLPYASTHPHLIAGDFIKNVSNTFTGASAQVAGSNKYVIKGIKPRTVPVDYKGRALVRCQWRSPSTDINRDHALIFSHSSGKECGGWFPTSAAVLTHVLYAHLLIPTKIREPSNPADASSEANPSSRPTSSGPSSTTGFDFATAASVATRPHRCEWASCKHGDSSSAAAAPGSAASLALLARHIETHLPDTTDAAAWKKKHQPAGPLTGAPRDAVANHIWQRTLTDEMRDAAGVPLGCALVLRNIARAIPKLRIQSSTSETSNGGPVHGTANGALSSSAAPHVNGDDATGMATTNGHVPATTDDADAEREEQGPKALMKRVFGASKEKLFYAMAHNIVLKDYVGIVLRLIAQGGG